MKLRIAAACVALSIVALVAPAPARAADNSPLPAVLSVIGESSITQAPDRATVSFQIESVNEQAAIATSRNASVVAALTARLSALGIAQSSIKTTSYGLSYSPRPPKPDPKDAQRYGYTVERTIDVTVDKTDSAGAIVDAGVAAGVTGVNGISFSLRDVRGALRTAQVAALADASDQAKSLAAAAGVRIVRIMAITPGGGAQPQPRIYAPRMAMAAAAPVPTQIDPTDLTVRATVSVQYEIAPVTVAR